MAQYFWCNEKSYQNRWTFEWYDGVPKLIRREINRRGADAEVYQIDGTDVPDVVTPGAFINFGTSTIFKNGQVNRLCENLANGLIQPGARILFCDFSNIGILSVRQ